MPQSLVLVNVLCSATKPLSTCPFSVARTSCRKGEKSSPALLKRRQQCTSTCEDGNFRAQTSDKHGTSTSTSTPKGTRLILQLKNMKLRHFRHEVHSQAPDTNVPQRSPRVTIVLQARQKSRNPCSRFPVAISPISIAVPHSLILIKA